jgi:hypothetical protein
MEIITRPTCIQEQNKRKVEKIQVIRKLILNLMMMPRLNNNIHNQPLINLAKWAYNRETRKIKAMLQVGQSLADQEQLQQIWKIALVHPFLSMKEHNFPIMQGHKLIQEQTQPACAGSTMRFECDYEQTVSVSGFHDGLGDMTNIPIGTSVTAHDHPTQEHSF